MTLGRKPKGTQQGYQIVALTRLDALKSGRSFLTIVARQAIELTHYRGGQRLILVDFPIPHPLFLRDLLTGR
jgi:hypothetical protein